MTHPPPRFFGGQPPRSLQGSVPFDAPVWTGVSAQAQRLILGMLHRDPAKRTTAQEALRHPWFLEGGSAPEVVDVARTPQSAEDVARVKAAVDNTLHAFNNPTTSVKLADPTQSRLAARRKHGGKPLKLG